MRSYLDLTSGTEKPLHTDYGMQAFVPPTIAYDVDDADGLFVVLDKAESSGGIIRVHGTIEVDDTVSIPSNTVLEGAGDGAGIRAANMSGHLLEVRDAENVMVRNLRVDGNEQDVKAMPIMRCRNIGVDGCDFMDCTTGISISHSTNVTIYNTLSHGMTEYHGIAIREKDMVSGSILIASCRLFDNNAYGIDSHGQGVEVAGCVIADNGQGEGGYKGVAFKSQSGSNHYIHDCSIVYGAGDTGLTPMWVDLWTDVGGPARNINVYRCYIQSKGAHINLRRGSELYLEENVYMDVHGNSVPLKLAGDGTKPKSKPVLRDPIMYPYVLDGRTQPEPDPDEPPTEPPPTSGLTELQVRAIVAEMFPELFAQEIGKVTLTYG